MPFLGEIFALATAVIWAHGSVFFTSASRRAGSFFVNRTRALFGSLILLVLHFVMYGFLFPQLTLNQFALLLLSSATGLVIGDSFLLQAYVDIGPRFTLLIGNLTPFFTAILAALILGEHLSLLAWTGMLVTITGTVWVMFDARFFNKNLLQTRPLRGVIFAMLFALCQGFGFVIDKPVIHGDQDILPLSATLIRLCMATVFWMIITLFVRDWRQLAKNFA